MYDPDYEETFETFNTTIAGIKVTICYQTDDHEHCAVLDPKTDKDSQEYLDLWNRSTEEERAELIEDVLYAITKNEWKLEDQRREYY